MIKMKRRHLTVLCVGVMTAGAIGMTATSALAATDSDGSHCSTGTLPDSVMGNPGVKPGQATGFFLWHDSKGYSLRVTHPGSARLVFSGTLTSSRGFSHVSRVALEKDDRVRLSSNHRTLSFRFVDVGKIDGINFAADCSKIMKATLRIDSALAGPEQVKLGRHRASPTSNPFTIERHVEAPRAPAPTPTPTGTSAATPTATIG